MPVQSLPDQLTPREAVIMENEKEAEIRQMDYGRDMAKLDIEVRKIEARFSAWLRIPLMIIRLPLLVILGIAYIVHAIRGIEPSENFWKLLK